MAEPVGSNWCEPASAGQRAEWAHLLASAYANGFIPAGDRDDVAEILLQIAADPAASVRRALSSALAGSPAPSRDLVMTLVDDVHSVALPQISQSPLLADDDLVEIVRRGQRKLVDAVLMRASLSAPVAAAIVSAGEGESVLTLLRHPDARIEAESLRAIADRFAGDAEIRGALFDRADLPAALRQRLLVKASEAVAGSFLAAGVLGASESRRICEEASERGTATIVEEASRADLEDLIDDLLLQRALSSAILLRLACSGSLDTLTECLTRLTGTSARRVRSILVESRRQPFNALCARAGLPSEATALLFHAVDVWRAADHRGDTPTPNEVAARIMTRLAEEMRKDPSRSMEPALAFLRGLSREIARTNGLRDRRPRAQAA
ncbi:DUF2336 domain-containing protein [Fulvimarina endophytica]|nr:DUF2336 domain-containing protein [Fulvimarina endophytica]